MNIDIQMEIDNKKLKQAIEILKLIENYQITGLEINFAEINNKPL